MGIEYSATRPHCSMTTSLYVHIHISNRVKIFIISELYVVRLGLKETQQSETVLHAKTPIAPI